MTKEELLLAAFLFIVAISYYYVIKKHNKKPEGGKNMKVLVVVDMQEDFLRGALANPDAVAIEPAVVNYIKNFDGVVYATRDTHAENYMDTQEGKNLPIPHCIKGTPGHEITADVKAALDEKGYTVIDKPTFGSTKLAETISNLGDIDSITIIGVCTDICVISNAMLIKAALPEVEVKVISSCCAGVTKESHQTALNAMAACQINIIM